MSSAYVHHARRKEWEGGMAAEGEQWWHHTPPTPFCLATLPADSPPPTALPHLELLCAQPADEALDARGGGHARQQLLLQGHQRGTLAPMRLRGQACGDQSRVQGRAPAVRKIPGTSQVISALGLSQWLPRWAMLGMPSFLQPWVLRPVGDKARGCLRMAAKRGGTSPSPPGARRRAASPLTLEHAEDVGQLQVVVRPLRMRHGRLVQLAWGQRARPCAAAGQRVLHRLLGVGPHVPLACACNGSWVCVQEGLWLEAS